MPTNCASLTSVSIETRSCEVRYLADFVSLGEGRIRNSFKLLWDCGGTPSVLVVLNRRHLEKWLSRHAQLFACTIPGVCAYNIGSMQLSTELQVALATQGNPRQNLPHEQGTVGLEACNLTLTLHVSPRQRRCKILLPEMRGGACVDLKELSKSCHQRLLTPLVTMKQSQCEAS